MIKNRTMEGPIKDENQTQHPVLEWETQGASQQPKSFSDRLNNVLPPHKRYIGLRRRAFLIVVAIITLTIFGLILGLAIGLTIGHKRCALVPRDFNFMIRC